MFYTQLRLRAWRQLQATWEGCNNRAAIAGSLSASLAALILCFAYGSIFCSSTCTWAAPELHRVPIERGALPPPLTAAPSTLATHEPYTTEPPSFLTSAGYQGICISSAAQQQDCIAGALKASSHERAQPCTPDNMRHWGGNGSWLKDEGGHFMYVCPCSRC